MRVIRILVGLCLSASSIALAGPSTARAAALAQSTVTVDGGQIDGVRLPSGVRAFLGVPFAAAPVRDLRWRDPQPVSSWQGVRHADRFAPQCMQPQRGTLTNQYSGAEVTSEDCLYLNVWASSKVSKAPVIVFIHGGGFFIGSSSMPLYSGEAISQKGVVFVNFNYRVGPLGFLAHPALSAESPHKTSGDYGFLDQIAALKWVRRNIAQFGGDPGNVTIAGQSAGSMSVLTLQASPLSKGLFQRAVGMSGAQLGGPMAMQTLTEAEQDGVRLQGILKADSIAQLRALPADRIVVPRTPGGPKVGPVQDGYVLPRSIESTFEASAQQDVPLLLGFTHDESFGGLGPVTSLADYNAKARASFGEAAPRFLALYPATNDREAQAAARLADRDATMAVSMNAWADAQFKYGHAPIYSYEFSRHHTFAPGVRFTDLDPATAGAYHTSEVPFWLGTLGSFNRYRITRAWSAADIDFSELMMSSLVAFAKTGNPDFSSLRWPRYSPASRQLMELGSDAQVSAWPSRDRIEFFSSMSKPARVGGVIRD